MEVLLNVGTRVMDEQAVIGHAQDGDAAAFAALFEQYHGPITRYLYRLVRDPDLADDLAQDTFVKAYRALGQTRADLNFRAWLYRIASNTAASHFRRRRIIQWLPFTPSTPEPVVDARFAEALGEREAVEAALRRISPSYANALLLRHDQDLSVAEVAYVLGISVNAAKVRLFRARKAFAAAYEAVNKGQEGAS